MHIHELETPAVIVDLDVLEANLQGMSEYCAQHKLALRPHTKTHKIPLIAQMQRKLGSYGITVAKVGEAEVMAKGGMEDILIHYPIFGTTKLDRLAKLAVQCKITMAIDSTVTADAISAAAVRAGSVIRVYVEVDTGMRRCGTASPADALALAQYVERLPGIQLAGISTYPGHIWAHPKDQGPALTELAALLGATVDEFKNAGLPCETVSAGSTPTAKNSHQVGPLTEIRPGTYVFNDRNTAGVGACAAEDCALRVLVTVVSTAVHGRAVVDGGSKTFSSDRWVSGSGGHGLVVEQPDVEFISMSEEHGNLDITKSGYSPKIGDLLSIIPNHVCACVNMHETITFTERESWKDRGLSRAAARFVSPPPFLAENCRQFTVDSCAPLALSLQRTAMTGFPQLKAVSIRETVGEAIRQALLGGRFRPGQALSEVALAAEMKVSRGPVRESLLMLAQEGLVSHSQNYGFSVLQFTERDCREVQEVRLPLETLALELARDRVTADDLRNLLSQKHRIVKKFQEGDLVNGTQTDLAFHRLIWERSENSRLLATLCNLLVPYFAYGSAFNIGRPDLTAELLDAQHQSYLDFLQRAESRTAEECVRFHAGL